MRAEYVGANCNRIKRGIVYDVDYRENGARRIVSVEGEGFRYSFHYDSQEALERSWKFES